MFFEKIGDWVKHNQADIVLVVGFVLAAAVAFGAGRLSAPETIRNPIVIEEPVAASIFTGDVSQSIVGAAEKVGQSDNSDNKDIIVASKNGKKYYWVWCSSAANIKTENRIWFKSEQEAKNAGYSPSVCIAQQAPAGYQNQ